MKKKDDNIAFALLIFVCALVLSICAGLYLLDCIEFWEGK